MSRLTVVIYPDNYLIKKGTIFVLQMEDLVGMGMENALIFLKKKKIKN
tara:strand:- start:52468 stop:52611 length:144 start_codon:yes stop_codon:yes gene_type:complete